jgi:putative restriction endonuclease
MAKAVFTSKIGSAYDDNVELHYHFPATYLRATERAVGDMIVYYEPRRGGQMSYFGVAELVGIRPDLQRSGLYYADLANYLDFDRKVPFLEGGRYYESALRAPDGSVNAGQFQRAVRNLSDDEFAAIVDAGFALASPWPDTAASGFGEEEQPPFAQTSNSVADAPVPGPNVH